jgi:putative DNA primase/helicase
MSFEIKTPNIKNFERPLSGGMRADFEQWLKDQGLSIRGELVTEGKIGRAYIEEDGRRKERGWYQVWLNQESPFGQCGDYAHDSIEPTARWNPRGGDSKRKFTPEELAELERQRAKYKQEKIAKQAIAAKQAQRAWEKAEQIDTHPYLQKKQVKSYGLRESAEGRLLIPMLDATLTIVGMQGIEPDGTKKYFPGSKAAGSFFMIGQDQIRNAHTIYYAEGYATAASVYEDMQQPVIVAFSASNLPKVAKVIQSYFPNPKHVIMADCDDDDTGEKWAIKAAQVIRAEGSEAEVFMPEEQGDYNDMKTEVEGELLPKVREVNVPVEYEFEKTEKGRMLNTSDNVRGVLTINQIDVCYNVIKKRMEITVPNRRFIRDLKEEAALVEIEDRCIKMGVPATKVRDYLKLLAREYNPVKEWMESKPWDGKDRMTEFLNTIQSPQPHIKDMLMTKWLIGATASVYEDEGVALEGILVFQGAQGLGKTLWFKRLADYEQGWLLEGATLNPSDKDSVKQAVSHWLVELGEIESTFKKSDIDQLKAFVTRKTDELRLPYDRTFTNYQRRTAFYASVNAREFLTDTSGNRRFWVVPVSHINYNHGIDMQQVWAQVAEQLYEKGNQNWFLTSEERAMLNDHNESYRTQSAVEDLLMEYVDWDSDMTEPVQMTTLLRDLGIANPRVADFKEASRVLQERGVLPRKTMGKRVYDIKYTPVKQEKLGNVVPF